LVAALALAARAWRVNYWPADVAGAGFLAAHGLIHLASIVFGHDHHATFDFFAEGSPRGARRATSAGGGARPSRVLDEGFHGGRGQRRSIATNRLTARRRHRRDRWWRAQIGGA